MEKKRKSETKKNKKRERKNRSSKLPLLMAIFLPLYALISHHEKKFPNKNPLPTFQRELPNLPLPVSRTLKYISKQPPDPNHQKNPRPCPALLSYISLSPSPSSPSLSPRLSQLPSILPTPLPLPPLPFGLHLRLPLGLTPRLTRRLFLRRGSRRLTRRIRDFLRDVRQEI